MRIAIIGGTFNPVHFGHLFLAEEIFFTFGPDRILFIPTNMPAHKKRVENVSPEDRLAMLQLAVAGDERIIVDECEIHRSGVSYMIDTLKEVHKKYPFTENPALVIGDDLVSQFHTWKEFDNVLKLSRLVIAHRLSKEKLKPEFPHTYIDNKILPLSSTEIRERIKKGFPIRFLLPDNVCEYIKQKHLYRQPQFGTF